jgi:SAM-dependent methyltransferase
MTGDATDMEDYSARYLHQYQERSFETTLVAIRRAQVIDAMRRYPHGHVLEIGCGLEPLFQHVDGWERFSIVEPSEMFVENARRIAGGREGIEVIQGLFGRSLSELAGLKPDFIAVSSLLHEVPDAQELLAAVRDVTTGDAVAHFNVPNMRSFHRLLAMEMGLIADVFEPSEMELRFQRRTRYDLSSLVAIVEAAGFRVLRSGTYFMKPFTHAQMQAAVEGGIIDQRVIDGLAAVSRHFPGMGAEAFVDVVRT